MSEQSVTPGPWFRSGVRRKVDGMDNHSIVATVGGKEITVATVWYDPRTHEGFHDANLIAASPALLEALKGAIGALEFNRDYHTDLGNEEQAFCQDKLDAALAAISQAEGRDHG